MIRLKEARILKKKKKDLMSLKNQLNYIIIQSIIHNRNISLKNKITANILNFKETKKKKSSGMFYLRST